MIRKYTSHWFPSFDDVNEKVIFNLQIICPKVLVAISNGVLKSVKPLDNGFKTFLYEMQKPMSSYLLAIAIGDYANKTVASKGSNPSVKGNFLVY